jgi:chitinase
LASNAAEAIAAEVALDIAAKSFCRIAVPALLLPLELIEDAIPIVGMYSSFCLTSTFCL